MNFRSIPCRCCENTYRRTGYVADPTADTQASAGLSFAELEKLKALREVARNPSGLGPY